MMTAPFTVMVTGSRDLTDRATLVHELNLLLDRRKLLILVGDCPTGSDPFTREWVKAQVRAGAYVGHRVFYAHWDLYGKRAGPERNKRMVDERPDLVLAFFEPGAANIGTAGAVKLARAAGIPVREYGRETQETPGHEQETLPI